MLPTAAELRRLLDRLPELICQIDASGRYQFANKAYVERFGRSLESVVGRHISEVIGASAYAAIAPHVERALGGEHTEFEIEIPYEKGPRLVKATYAPERDPSGTVTGFVASIVDQTARRQAEEALRLSREHLNFIVESTEVGVWSCDLPFDVLLWNAKCKEHFGLPPDAVVTINTFYDRMHPDDVERTRHAIDASIASRVNYDTEYRTLPREGETAFRWVRAMGRAAYAPDGTPVRFDGVTVDITAQKEREALLREREAYFRYMADHAPAMLWVTDAQGRATYLSKQWYEYTGRAPQDELGFGWLQDVHADDRQATQDVFLGAHARRIPFTIDYRLRRHDGHYRWAVDAGVPRFTAAGEFEGFIGSVIDVHERKVVEQALAEGDRRKDEFLATLAHELRNPLAPLLTALHLIQHGGADQRMRDRALPIMERQVTQLVRLVDDLLDVSRITRGKLNLQLEPVDLAKVIDGAIEATHASVAAQAHQVEVRMPDAPVILYGDATRLSQVFQNLLNNAAKYTPRGGHIQIHAETRDDRVNVRVVDNGIGFTPDDADRIFDMFVQAEESKEFAQGGLGIGLTLVRQLVLMHDGTITARSEGKGRGSEFDITLPLVVDANEAQALDLHERDERGTPQRRILIADDNEDAAATLALLLERDGHAVRTAPDGVQALTVAAAFQPEVVLLDIGMPRLNGYDVARSLRRLPFGSSILIAAVTGWGQPRDHERSRAAGIDRHFRKPVAPADLRRLLRDVPSAGRT
jgi:PAS domain S-box-containing protein